MGTFPTEICVNLLMKGGLAPQEALDVGSHATGAPRRVRLSCPNLVELCQQTKRYDVLAEAARAQGNPVNFMAGLIAAGKK